MSGTHLSVWLRLPRRVLGVWALALVIASPAAESLFTATASMNNGRQGMPAVRLNDGRVLVVGGPQYHRPGGITCPAEIYDPARGTWTPTGGTLPDRIYSAAVLLTNGKVLVAGGSVSGSITNSSYLYDPVANSWSQTGNMTSPRFWHTMTVLTDGRVLAVGGFSGQELSSCEIYNIGTETWTPTQSLSSTSYYHAAALMTNGNVLVSGGYSSNETRRTARIYNAGTNTWTPTNSMISIRSAHTLTQMADGRIAAIGGRSSTSMPATCEIYDPASGNWVLGATLNTARQLHTASLLPSGEILVIGGGDISTIRIKSCEIVSPTLGSATLTDDLPWYTLRHASAQLADGSVLVVGGEQWTPDASTFHQAAIFNPSQFAADTFPADTVIPARAQAASVLLPDGSVVYAGGNTGIFTNYTASTQSSRFHSAGRTWAASGAMGVARSQFSLTLLPSGKALAIGGRNGDSVIASSELYNTAGAGSWSASGNLATGRCDHTANLMMNGQVLVVGGVTNITSTEYTKTDTCEWYNPGTGLFSPAPSLNETKSNHCSVVLADGRLLVAGGVHDGTISKSCFLFDPIAGTWSPAAPLNTERLYHAMVLLPSGKVLAAGGRGGSSGGTLSSSELYDPALNEWHVTVGTLSGGVYGHNLEVLPNGSVLLIGGVASAGVTIPAYRTFDPLSEMWKNSSNTVNYRVDSSAAMLPDGAILQVGGSHLNSAQKLSRICHWLPASSVGLPVPNVTASTATVVNGGVITLMGTNFMSTKEGAGGGVSGSAVNAPVVEIRSGVNGQLIRLALATGTTFSATSVSARVHSVPPGPAWVRVWLNGGKSTERYVLVQRGSQAITFPAFAAHTYGEEAFTATGLVGGGSTAPVILTSSNSTVARIGSNNAIILTGSGSVTINANQSGDASYENAPQVSRTLMVNKATLSVTANPAERVYGAGNPAFSGIVSGIVNADDGPDNIAVTFGSSAVNRTPVGNYSGGHALAINPIFSDPDGRLIHYTIETVTGALTISPAPLNVVAADGERAFGQANPVFSGTITGIISPDNISASYASSANASTPNGIYGPGSAEAITPTLIDPDGRLVNYTVTSTQGTLRILAAQNIVGFVAIPQHQYGDAPFSLPALSGGGSGNPIVYSSSDPLVATISDSGVIAITGSGSTHISVNQDGNTNYAAAPTITHTLVVTKKPATAQAMDYSRMYGDADSVGLATVSGLVNGDVITATGKTTAEERTDVGVYSAAHEYAMKPDYTDVGNRLMHYEMTETKGELTIVSRPLQHAATNAWREYGAPNPVFTGTLTGAVAGDNLSGTYFSAADAVTPIGVYEGTSEFAIQVTTNDPDTRLGNYTLTETPGRLRVTAVGTGSGTGNGPGSGGEGSEDGGGGCGAGGAFGFIATFLMLTFKRLSFRREVVRRD